MSQEKVDKEKQREELRKEALKDAETLAPKQRFALFSFPPPIGLGDDSQEHKIIPKRDENGKPVTELSNIKVKATRTGQVASSFFSLPKFKGDVYVDPERANRIYELEKQKLIKNDAIFKPASGYKEIINATYDHKSDIDPKQPRKNYRDKDGKVLTAPKNVTTNPKNKLLYKFPGFMKDEFARASEQEKTLWENSKKMMKEQPFKSTVAGGDNFTEDKLAFGLQGKVPVVNIDIKQNQKSKPPKEVKLNIYNHETAFKPSNPPKKGVNGTIAPYPEYKGNKIEPLTRKDQTKTKDPFKPNHGGNLTRPTPTISCYPQNIRREMASKAI